MAAGSLSAMNTGAHIVVGGLVIQLLFFGFFVYVAGLFHYRVKNRASTSKPYSSPSFETWELMMWTLYAACLLIFVRSVFRVVEFVEGNDGFIMQREYLLYIFDALLMIIQAIILFVVYPGNVLQAGKDQELQLESRGDSSEGFVRASG